MIFSQGADLRNGDTPSDPAVEIDHWIRVFKEQSLVADKVVKLADVDAFVHALMASFQVIKAAGGFVVNPEDKLLMIFRRGHWDLPKGKLDRGESTAEAAVREVEEECGVGGLKIVSNPFSTFHLYAEKGSTVIKESVWYRMETAFDGAPIPQVEEDITQACWEQQPVADSIMKGAYRSIVEVINHFSIR